MPRFLIRFLTKDLLTKDFRLKIASNIGLFFNEIWVLIKSPVFVMLTIIGNGLIGMCGGMFYILEEGTNPRLVHYIDAVWWSFATATTTGYGDITPVTMGGKILGILLMLMGTALFAMYTGLFAEVILHNARKHLK